MGAPIKTGTHKTPRWAGELTIAGGWALYHGPAGDTGFHSHYPIQIVLGGSQSVTIKLENGKTLTETFMLIPSGISHQLMETKVNIDLLYVEPTLVTDRAMEFRSLSEWLKYLTPIKQTIDDARLRKAIVHINASLDAKVTLEAAAKCAGMSKSLFSLKFRRATGLPLRRYVLWRRLYQAVLAIAEGYTATQAAHSAGFSDSAHFSRTMRETFGVSASSSLQQIKMTVLESPEHQKF